MANLDGSLVARVRPTSAMRRAAALDRSRPRRQHGLRKGLPVVWFDVFHCRTVEMSQPMCPRKNSQCSLVLAAVIQVNVDRVDPPHNIDGRLDTRHAGLLGPSTESRGLDLVFHCNRQIPIPKGSPVCPLSLVKQSGANERGRIVKQSAQQSADARCSRQVTDPPVQRPQGFAS